MTGRIIAHYGLHVHIDVGDEIIKWKPPRRETWIAGDVVIFAGKKPKTIAPRRNELARIGFGGTRQALAANLDKLLIVAVAGEAFKSGLVDRFIVAAEHAGIKPAVVVNKIDLDSDRCAEFYRSAGYDLFYVSAVTGEGIDEFVDYLQDGVSAMVGPSGAGKTSLLNRIAPGIDRAVAAVQEKTGKGRHTTTTALLVDLPSGGSVIDSPGVRQFVPSDVSLNDAALYFPGISRVRGCKFRDCLHLSEPGCAVRKALGAGSVSDDLYASYIRLIESIRNQAEPDWR